MIKIGSTPEIRARRAKLLVALAKKGGTVGDVAKVVRRDDHDLVRDDLEALRKIGLVGRESKPAVYSLS
jgi:hypothetical protein